MIKYDCENIGKGCEIRSYACFKYYVKVMNLKYHFENGFWFHWKFQMQKSVKSPQLSILYSEFSSKHCFYGFFRTIKFVSVLFYCFPALAVKACKHHSETRHCKVTFTCCTTTWHCHDQYNSCIYMHDQGC